MKKGISLTLALLMAFSFAACKEEPQAPEHTHTYATDWTQGAGSHWHAASCDHTTEKSDEAYHTDADKDGDCDVCGYVDTEHTHKYEAAWTTDATDHWHAASCDHTALIVDKAAHTANVLGECSVCGYQVSATDVSTAEKAIAVALYQKSLVKFGELMEGEMFSDVDVDYGAYSTEKYVEATYTFGDGAYYEEKSENESVDYATVDDFDENYAKEIKTDYFLNGEEAYGVQTEYNVIWEDYNKKDEVVAASLENLNGYNVVGGDYGLDENAYGMEALAAATYEKKTKDLTAAEIEAAVEPYGLAVDFEYGYEFEVFNGVTVKKVQVVFSLNEESYFLDAIAVAAYTYDDAKESDTDEDWDFAIDDNDTPEEPSDDTYTMNPELGQPDKMNVMYAYQYANHKFAPDVAYAESFKIVDDLGEEVTSLEVDAKSGTVNLYLSDVAPWTANLGIDTVTISVDKENGLGAYIPYGRTDVINLSPNEVGEYVVTVSTANVTKTINVSVTMPETTSFDVYTIGTAIETDWRGNETELYPALVDANTIEAYVGDEVGFFTVANGDVENSTWLDNGFTYEVTSGEAENVTVNVDGTSLDGVYYYMSNYGSYGAFGESDGDMNNAVFAAAGTYVITLTSTANTELSDTLTVNVQAKPTTAEIKTVLAAIGTKYAVVEDGEDVVTVTVTPDTQATADEIKGTITLVSVEDVEGTPTTVTDVYNYSVSNYEFTLTLATDDTKEVFYSYYGTQYDYSFYFNNSYEVCFGYYDDWSGAWTKVDLLTEDEYNWLLEKAEVLADLMGVTYTDANGNTLMITSRYNPMTGGSVTYGAYTNTTEATDATFGVEISKNGDNTYTIAVSDIQEGYADNGLASEFESVTEIVVAADLSTYTVTIGGDSVVFNAPAAQS